MIDFSYSPAGDRYGCENRALIFRGLLVIYCLGYVVHGSFLADVLRL
jgi:hypothetical protein